MVSATNDFFVSILVDIQEKLHKQCVSLSGYVSVDNYTQLSQFFNANLSGKFPFVAKCEPDSPDANPEDLRTFFEMIDSQATGIKATLKEATNLGPAGQNALAFVEQMEGVRKFFGGYVAPNSTMQDPAFNFEVSFRVNRDKEIRANEIIGWELTTRNSTISQRSPSNKGYWEAGDPLQVTFRWAANSPLQPLEDDCDFNTGVQGGTVNYTFDGTWALLRLLRNQQANAADFRNLIDEHPTTLRFDIPLVNVIANIDKDCGDLPLEAVAFISLSVSPIVFKKEKDNSASSPSATASQKPQMGQPVQLPKFPYRAPQLNMTGG
jgi:type VI secretion system protein ImpL